jgi:hypothetical protein
MTKVNAKDKTKLQDLAKLRDNGGGQADYPLTDGEKVQMAIMLEKVNGLQAQLNQASQATADLISSIVKARGLDPKKFGVNLAAGKILPTDEVKGK